MTLIGLLILPFSQRLVSVFATSVGNAAQEFAQELPKYKFPANPVLAQANDQPTDSQTRAPPAELAVYYPVANVSNKLLGALNELRTCAVLCLKKQITDVTMYF